MINSDWEVFDQANRHITAQERHPIEQEVPNVLHTTLVGPPMLQPKIDKVLKHVEALRPGNVKVCSFLDLFKDPGLDDSTPRDHYSGSMALFLEVDSVLPRINVSVGNERYGCHCTTLLHVLSISKLGVTLLL
jgi:hypothetical protein